MHGLRHHEVRGLGAAFLSVVVAVLLAILFLAWLKFRRVRFAERAVALERQRMAADLHDTIEQNLAAVKILLTCAAKPAGVPDETKKVLEQAAAMLIHAKGEVRSTIMNLRSAGEEGKGLSDHLREMAARSGFALEFVRDDKWTAVRLEVGG